MIVRDKSGFVLCCHGRPIQCNECAEDYEAELSLPVRAAERKTPEPERLAREVIDQIRESLGMLPDPWPLDTHLDDGTSVVLTELTQFLRTKLQGASRCPQ